MREGSHFTSTLVKQKARDSRTNAEGFGCNGLICNQSAYKLVWEGVS